VILLRRGLGVLGELLITLGAVLLLFVGWQLWWTDVTADREQAGTVRTLERDFGAPGATPPATALQEPRVRLDGVPRGRAFAIVRIPRLGAHYARPVLEGTDHDTLSAGVGHYAGTAMPGAVGNFAVAGHRTTYGRPFHDIETLAKGDTIVVETRSSYVVYAVDRHVIVTPDHVEVIAAVPQQVGVRPTQPWMTLTACHPKFSASHRYVVFAELVRTIPRAQGLPASYLRVPGKAA
jgi:sortase A